MLKRAAVLAASTPAASEGGEEAAQKADTACEEAEAISYQGCGPHLDIFSVGIFPKITQDKNLNVRSKKCEAVMDVFFWFQKMILDDSLQKCCGESCFASLKRECQMWPLDEGEKNSPQITRRANYWKPLWKIFVRSFRDRFKLPKKIPKMCPICRLHNFLGKRRQNMDKNQQQELKDDKWILAKNDSCIDLFSAKAGQKHRPPFQPKLVR